VADAPAEVLAGVTVKRAEILSKRQDPSTLP
jgi:hypothetical protein